MRKDRERQWTLTGRTGPAHRCAIVLPVADAVADLPPDAPLRHAKDTAEVDRRGVDAVLAPERRLGRTPHEQAHNHPGRRYGGPNRPPPKPLVEAHMGGASFFLSSRPQVRLRVVESGLGVVRGGWRRPIHCRDLRTPHSDWL